jgi:hypothetical protein
MAWISMLKQVKINAFNAPNNNITMLRVRAAKDAILLVGNFWIKQQTYATSVHWVLGT